MGFFWFHVVVPLVQFIKTDVLVEKITALLSNSRLICTAGTGIVIIDNDG